MKIRFKNKILVFTTMLLLLFSTICYADSLPKNDLDNAMTEMFSKDIEIYIKRGDVASTRKIDSKDMKIENSKITVTDKKTKEQFVIEYNLNSSGKWFFKTSYEIDIDTTTATDEEIKTAIMGLDQFKAYEVIYLAIADSLEKDLSLAYAYFDENLLKGSKDIYDFEAETVEGSEKQGEMKLTVNTEELAKLDNSKLTTAMECKITLSKKSTQTEGSGNTVEDSNKEQSSTNGNNSNESDKKTENDGTTADMEKIPAAGTEFGIENVLEILIFVAIVGIVILVIKHLYSLKKEE